MVEVRIGNGAVRPLNSPSRTAGRGQVELTPTQKEILARLKDLNATQAAALEKQVTSYAEFQEIEKREDEIIALHRELIESIRSPR